MRKEELHKQAESQRLEFKESFGTGFFRIQQDLQEYPELQLTIETLQGFTRSGLDVIVHDTPHGAPHDAPHDNFIETSFIRSLLNAMDGEMSRQEIQHTMGLNDRFHFRKFYLKPALVANLIEMTIPEKPNSRYQKYRLTIKGKEMKEKWIKQVKHALPTIKSPP